MWKVCCYTLSRQQFDTKDESAAPQRDWGWPMGVQPAIGSAEILAALLKEHWKAWQDWQGESLDWALQVSQAARLLLDGFVASETDCVKPSGLLTGWESPLGRQSQEPTLVQQPATYAPAA